MCHEFNKAYSSATLLQRPRKISRRVVSSKIPVKDFKILDENIGARIQRDLDNSAALEGVHPRDYPHDIYLNGDQYYEWMNEMIDTYASRNPDNQCRDS